MTTTTYLVSGMTCGHCVASVTEEVSEIPGVTEVRVDLGSGAVTVDSDGPLDRALVEQAISDAGYELTEA